MVLWQYISSQALRLSGVDAHAFTNVFFPATGINVHHSGKTPRWRSSIALPFRSSSVDAFVVSAIAVGFRFMQNRAQTVQTPWYH